MSEEREILQSEVAKGRRAAAANSEFFQPFFDEKEEVLIEAFRTVSVTDSEALLNIKLQFKALDTLRDELNRYIETGKMANRSLAIAEEKENGTD